MAQALEQLFGGRFEIHHMAAATEMLPVGRTQHRTATSGDDRSHPLGQAIEHLLLDVPKLGFTLTVEKLTDGTTEAGFDGMVRIDERKAKPARKLPSYRGFT
ncbi:MAG: hypothetical protein A2037_03080 [Curvibacter sp. GWA2_63_95]|nr:MAG: hypothetical protein A2037_03080 [Curvibacter sp. GWA2_63_95]